MKVNIKLLFYGIIACIIVGLSIAVSYSVSKLKKLEAEYELAINNNKAFENENSSLKEDNIIFKRTIEELRYSKDSLNSEMLNKAKQLKIRDKEIKRLQYLASTASKKDTVLLKDTVYKDKDFKLDTLKGDQWYKVAIHMEYPNILTIEPSFTSKQTFIVSEKKETVDPPKKFFICRWFQKKVNITRVKVVEENPYIVIDKERYIDIVK
jgi:Fe-S cluster assembly scaffold protein SufB